MHALHCLFEVLILVWSTNISTVKTRRNAENAFIHWTWQRVFTVLSLCRQYSKITPENILVDTATERACVAYATFHSKSSSFIYRYRMKDVDCKTKAPFICRYNPGSNPMQIQFTRKMTCWNYNLFLCATNAQSNIFIQKIIYGLAWNLAVINLNKLLWI